MKYFLILVFIPLVIASQSSTLRDITILDESTIFAVGGDGTIIRTTNAGVTWEDISIETDGSVMEIESYADKLWIRTHLSDRIYYSDDLGDSWLEIYQFENDYILNMAFLNDTLGFISAGTHKLFKSINGGINWEQVDGPFSSGGPITFLNSLTGWIGGYNVIYCTLDGGNTWDKKGLEVFELNIREVQLLKQEVGFAVGDGYSNNNIYYGMFAMTEDNGETWYKKTFENSVQDIHFLNSDSGFIITAYEVLETIDKGRNWDKTDSKLKLFEFIDKKSWGLSNDGKILFSEDGWNTWVQQYPNPTSVEDEMLNQYFLSQNYPNPFNPSTKIIFFIRKAGNASIKIYDLLGKEILTLVNQNYAIGEYEIEFFGENLPSGVYFYRLQTGDFISTKKLLLIK